MLLTGELCHAAAGRRVQASRELFIGAEETREQGKTELLFVLRKFFFLKRAHGLNHKTNNMNIYRAKLSNPIPKKFSHWL